jgi:hypothetical protein
MTSKRRRLRVPASSLLLGTGAACAVGIGSTWASAAFSESIAVCVVVALYLSGRERRRGGTRRSGGQTPGARPVAGGKPQSGGDRRRSG